MTEHIAEDFIHGIFQMEIKNRFLCNVEISGEIVICYIPSSCRLSNFINMIGRPVLLKPIKTSKARTPYAVYAIKYRKNYILVNLTQSNKIIEGQLNRRYFSFLGTRKNISHEYKIGGYKTDLFIHDTNTLVEIKSTLSFSREAIFPSVYSERTVNQLKKISRLLDEGYKACYIFVSLNPGVKEIVFNKQVDDFYRAFIKCIKKGMIYCGFSIKLKNNIPEIHSKIKVNI